MEKTGLDLLREPFPPNQIGKLAKGSKDQTQCPASEKQNCKVCGGWHHPKMIHLDYVGHAALTDRLLDADPNWTWEPVGFKDGLPAFDETGGLWIKLTVCGVTRLGYGHAPDSQYKEIGSRQKECIGDALRNAAMRFGAALELWHKGDLHVDEDATVERPKAFESAHKPTDGAWDKLGADLQTVVFDLSNRVRTLASRKDLIGACDEVDETLAEFENKNDMKTALWEKLADVSAVRNGMKKIWEARKQLETA